MAKATKKNYTTLKVRDPEGKLHSSVGNGDAVHRAMAVLVAKGGKLQDVLTANEIKVKKNGNPGQIRMALGSMLRAIVRKGDSVKIGTIKVATLTQKVEVPVASVVARTIIKDGKKVRAKAKKASKPRAKKAAVPQLVAAE